MVDTSQGLRYNGVVGRYPYPSDSVHVAVEGESSAAILVLTKRNWSWYNDFASDKWSVAHYGIAVPRD